MDSGDAVGSHTHACQYILLTGQNQNLCLYLK